MRRTIRVALFSASLAVSLGVAFLVFGGQSSPWLAVPWLLSLVPFALATYDRPRKSGSSQRLAATALLLLVVAAMPVLVRVANLDPDRMHQDEFLTAYFSATHNFAHSSFFGSMPEYWEWQGQFPKPFFFLQRVFFTLFGASVLTERLSVQLYVAIVAVMLFLIVREVFDRKAALVAVCLYSFLAVSVYLETLGFMFISSTAIFTVFFYFALREYRTGETFYAALAGVACGFCYLTYYSSYLAFPLLLAFFAVHWMRAKSLRVVKNFAVALIGMIIVLAPFLAFLRYGNYVVPRTKQVSVLVGEWSPYREAIEKGTRTPASVIRENLILCLKSFFKDGIGGHGGYDFGRLAFFDRFSFALFLTGLVAGLVLLFRKSELLFVFLIIGASFLTGMVLTIAPPAYHRFGIAFPFLVILMTLPFYLLMRLPNVPVSVRSGLVGGLLLLFACINQRRFVEAVIRDQPPDEVRLSELLNQRFGGTRNLYVAAYDAFAFQKTYYFHNKWPLRHVETGFHSNLLKKFNANEKYVYVMIFADLFHKPFQEADPNGRFFRFSVSYSLFFN